MDVFIAGSTGVIGRRLVRALVARGHEVTALTRRADAADEMRRMGASSAMADALDRQGLSRAVAAASPDVVVHQLTALRGVHNFRNFDRVFAATNELRTRGTDNLLSAARGAGARRFIAQSYGSWIYQPTGAAQKTEGDPLDPAPPRKQRKSLDAIRHLEEAVTSAKDIQGVILRYGSFYGPGTSIAAEGSVVRQVKKGRVPVIGDGAGVWSFLHVEDAVSATIKAIEDGGSGIYNIADDHPAPVSDWLPALAAAVGAPRPRRIPLWLGRVVAGEVPVSLFTRIRGMSNQKAKRELGWTLRYESWKDGFRSGLDEPHFTVGDQP